MNVIDVSWFYSGLIATFCMYYPEIKAEFFILSTVKSMNDSLEQFGDAFFMISAVQCVCVRKVGHQILIEFV